MAVFLSVYLFVWLSIYFSVCIFVFLFVRLFPCLSITSLLWTVCPCFFFCLCKCLYTCQYCFLFVFLFVRLFPCLSIISLLWTVCPFLKNCVKGVWFDVVGGRGQVQGHWFRPRDLQAGHRHAGQTHVSSDIYVDENIFVWVGSKCPGLRIRSSKFNLNR